MRKTIFFIALLGSCLFCVAGERIFWTEWEKKVYDEGKKRGSCFFVSEEENDRAWKRSEEWLSRFGTDDFSIREENTLATGRNFEDGYYYRVVRSPYEGGYWYSVRCEGKGNRYQAGRNGIVSAHYIATGEDGGSLMDR